MDLYIHGPVVRYQPQCPTEPAVTKRSRSHENVRLINLAEHSSTPRKSAIRPPTLRNTRTPPECQLLRSPTSLSTVTHPAECRKSDARLCETPEHPQNASSLLPISRNRYSNTPRMSENRSLTSLNIPEPPECQPPNPRYYKTLQRPQNISCQTVHPIKYSSTPRMSATRSPTLQNTPTPPECPPSFYRTQKHPNTPIKSPL